MSVHFCEFPWNMVPQLTTREWIVVDVGPTHWVPSRGRSESAALGVCVCLYIHTHSECCRFTSAARRYPVRYTISKVSTGIPWSWSNVADMSCKNSVNSLGLSIQPCRTPSSLFNMSLIRESYFTGHPSLENMLLITIEKLYWLIYVITLSKLPSIPLFNNL